MLDSEDIFGINKWIKMILFRSLSRLNLNLVQKGKSCLDVFTCNGWSLRIVHHYRSSNIIKVL